MLKKATFKPHYQVFALPEEKGTILLSENNDHIALKGKLYADISNLLDGQHTTLEVCEALAHEFSASEVHYAIMRLEQAGYLVEADPIVSREAAAFWSLLDISTLNMHNQLAKAQVSIFSKNIPSAQYLAEKLNPLGVESKIDVLGNFNVLIIDDHLSIDESLFSEMTKNPALSWLLIQPIGPFFAVGPILTRDKKICDTCLKKQLLQQHTHSLSKSEAKAIYNLAHDIAAIEIVKFLIQPGKSQLLNKKLEVNTSTWKMQYFSIKPNSVCTGCQNNQLG